MNVVIASGIAAAQGILIKDTQALEVMHRVKAVVFDKTGTVTKGEPKVMEEILYSDGAENYVRRLVATAKHPVAMAVSRHLDDAEPYDCVQTVVGKGLEATVDGQILRGGSAAWLGVENPFKDGNLSLFCVALDGQLIAVYGLSDELRTESKEVVKAIQSKGVEIYLSVVTSRLQRWRLHEN